MTMWNPIATAPRTGESFLAVVKIGDEEFIRVVQYLFGRTIVENPVRTDGSFPDNSQFTHWMPLPELPGDINCQYAA